MPSPSCSFRIISIVKARRRLRIGHARAAADERFEIPSSQAPAFHVVEQRVDRMWRIEAGPARTAHEDGQALRSVSLTTPQYVVLSAVEAEPGMANPRLARAAFVTPQTMQAMLANLERDGLLRRLPDPAPAGYYAAN